MSLALAAQAASDTEPPVAKVNGDAISQEVFVLAMRQRVASGAKDSPALRELVLKDLVLRKVLAQQGSKAKLDSNAVFKQAVDAYRDVLLAQAWERKWLQDHPPSAKDLKEEYARVSKLAGNREYRIRQVLVRDETSAKLVLDQLGTGKSLADLAKEYSIEPLGKDEGGLLPWVNLTVLVPSLRDAVRQAKVGKLWAKPVQGPSGWHVLRIEETRPFSMPKLEDLQPQLAQAVSRAQLRETIQGLVKKAKIEFQ